MRGAGAEALLVVVLFVDVCLVLAIFRTLRLHPAPAFARHSLRAAARKMLAPADRRERWQARADEVRRENPLIEYIPYVLLLASLYLPAPLKAFEVETAAIGFGPFSEDRSSIDFLQTLWQVVAAAVGLTVAMIAFAFEAFIGTGQRQFGGSLRAYAKETRVLMIVRLGVTALFLNGAVLLGFGTDAPAGWAAIFSTAVATIALVGVVWTIEGTVKSLAPAELAQMRRHQLEEVVKLALRGQLLAQAGDLILRDGNGLPVERSYVPATGEMIEAGTTGKLRDVRLGPLARIAVRSGDFSETAKIFTLVSLDGEIGDDTDLATVPQPFSSRLRRRVQRSFRVTKSDGDPEEADLLAQIDRLHAVAKGAIRAHQANEWREISKLYELILLALPREAAKLGLPFEGAVAAPGIFGFGPMHQIEHNLYDELEVALEVNDSELVDAISYLPLSVAQRAAKLGANAIVASMLSLYPSMYALARRVNG